MLSKELLLSVSKPARYIGSELNAVKKDLSQMAVKVCLCFPDIYEIGMSHLGLRILYDLINRRSDCAAERVFSPWVDMEEKLKTGGIPLFSLESKAPVKDFDIVGFSLQYELCYTNVLNILALSGIPLKSSERDERHPLIIAGGSCVLNPEPVAEFIDCFLIGEAEEALMEVIDVYQRHKRNGKINKAALLEDLCVLEGVYVPALSQAKVSKRFVKDFENITDIDRWIVPYIEIVHDRIGIEIMRGCPNSCRFCQARSAFYPLRILSKEKILENARRLYRKTGYEEISLLSLSSSDHPELAEIVRAVMKEFKEKGVSISLPSLKAKNIIGELSSVLASMRKTTLTFAPEAGSECLRRLIKKNIDIGELFDVASSAYQAGYRLLKLYFMIGLPTETEQDLIEIRDLCVKLSKLKKEYGGHPAQLNVTISNFIPKPHTPFQWQGMDSTLRLLEKQNFLRDLFRSSRGLIHLKFHKREASFLEGVLARGDRRLSQAILFAFEAGAKFDAWDDLFNFSLWMEAFARAGIDPNDYLKPKPYSSSLCWDFIDMGIPKESLIKESQSAFSATP